MAISAHSGEPVMRITQVPTKKSLQNVHCGEDNTITLGYIEIVHTVIQYTV
jgi:hypothetical protein